MQRKSFIKIFSIVTMAMFCSLHAGRTIYSEPLIKFEDGVESEERLTIRVLDSDNPPYDGDRTADHVYYRENDTPAFSLDLTSYANDNSSSNSSVSYEKPDICSNYYDSSQNDVFRYNDAEANIRDMQGYRNEYQDNDYVPDYNNKESNLIKTKEPHLLEKIQLLSPEKWPDAVTMEEEFYLWAQELGCWRSDALREAQHRKENRIAAYQKCKDNPLNCKEYRYDLSSNAKAYLYKN